MCGQRGTFLKVSTGSSADDAKAGQLQGEERQIPSAQRLVSGPLGAVAVANSYPP